MFTKLETIFPTPSDPNEKVFKVLGHGRKSGVGFNYQIFPLASFKELVELAGSGASKKNKFRFVIDTDLQAWFALEGRPAGIIPPHFGLVSTNCKDAICRTAGNIKVEDNKLISINHKSGDFSPSFDSLFYLLILLANSKTLPFEIPATFEIDHLTSAGGHGATYTIEKNDFLRWGAIYSDRFVEQSNQKTSLHIERPGASEQARRVGVKRLFAPLPYEPEVPSPYRRKLDQSDDSASCSLGSLPPAASTDENNMDVNAIDSDGSIRLNL